MNIPAEIRIKSTIKPGAVYYFSDEELSSDEPHYFIVLNHTPLTDEVVLLVCSSSQIEKVKRRIQRRALPATTIVEITPDEYPGFTKDSIINCNTIFRKKLELIIERLRQGSLKLKPVMDTALVEKLRAAALQSPEIEEEIKEYLR